MRASKSNIAALALLVLLWIGYRGILSLVEPGAAPTSKRLPKNVTIQPKFPSENGEAQTGPRASLVAPRVPAVGTTDRRSNKESTNPAAADLMKILESLPEFQSLGGEEAEQVRLALSSIANKISPEAVKDENWVREMVKNYISRGSGKAPLNNQSENTSATTIGPNSAPEAENPYEKLLAADKATVHTPEELNSSLEAYLENTVTIEQ